jgi:predicted subunit of tRNA(5-methylaminomethyl-2-thiouridylate) methyltransferase
MTSGGKDSELLEWILKKYDCKRIFTNTSLDCADTYKQIKQKKDIIIINPKEGFYQWQKRNNLIWI